MLKPGIQIRHPAEHHGVESRDGVARGITGVRSCKGLSQVPSTTGRQNEQRT
jgi:hypothetical protein